MSEYVVTDTELTAVADAIRTKGGTQANLEWYADFVSAIGAISGGGDAKIYEFIDEDYYMDSTGTICVIDGYTYTKTNADPAFVAYWHKSSNYTGPVLVSETEDGAKYTVNGSTFNPSSVTIDGKSWYISADTYYQYGDLTKSGGFAQKLSGSYASISSAAEALLALAFNNLITENGTYNVPSGYDGFGDFEVDVDPDLETLLATQNGTYTSQNKDGYSTVTVNVSGGGGITKDLIYEFNESQGGVWINTEVDVSNIDHFLFEGYLSGTKSKETLLSKNFIPVSSYSYIKVFTMTYDCNVQIRNDYLYISFGYAGSSSNVVKVYSVEMSQGGGSTNILSGTDSPTSSVGSDGAIYLQYKQIGIDLSQFSNTNEASMVLVEKSNSKIQYAYTSGGSIGARAVYQIDLTDINEITVQIKTGANSYNSYQTPRFCPFIYIDSNNRWAVDADAQSGIGAQTKVSQANSVKTETVDVSSYTGTYYVMFNGTGCDCSLEYMILDDGVSTNAVMSAFLKVNGAWQALIGSDIEDVNTGGGSTGEYVFEASGDDYETSSNSVTLDDSELYMFCTVYDGDSFSNASIIAGKTQPVYTTQGYGRVIAFIRPSSTNVSYGRFGSIDTNKYVGLNVKNGNKIVNDNVAMVLDSFTSTSGSFSAIEGKVYVFGTDANAFDGTFTGADVIASALLGDVDSKRTAFFIVKATATTVQYSKSGTHYYARLKYTEYI